MWPLKTKKNTPSKPSKRGEKQTQSLIRRRRLSLTVRGIGLVTACVTIVFSVYIWKSGLFQIWTVETKDSIDRQIAHAGLSIGEVRITGQKETDIKEIRNALALYDGQSMVSFDLDAMIERLESLPWVKRAVITRIMPDILDVSITENIAVAFWQARGKIYLINQMGEIITDENTEKFIGLPHLVGQGANEHLAEILIMKSQYPDLFAKVKSSVRIGNRRWDLNFHNGIKIKLPEKGYVLAWQKLYEYENNQKILAKEVLIVDFRQQGKTVLRLTPAEAERRRLTNKIDKKAENI
ncbi:MAG: FtsQ-type POTRA domain-containing protein [Emcibacter sp.]|nr:FtsQ-type POTRA domain-containing protein [Emcibacter sp.]